MKALLLIICLILTSCVGIEPFSPDNTQKTSGGRDAESNSNQNSLLFDIWSNKQKIIGSSGNFGIQGDGIVIGSVVVILGGVWIILHYRNEYLKNKKIAETLGKEIANGNQQIQEQVFLAVLKTDIEKDVFKLILKNKNKNENI